MPRSRCPFCEEPFTPWADEPRFVRHLRHRHGWDKPRARQFIAAQAQCRAPEWMQRQPRDLTRAAGSRPGP